jgi:long-chain acyl-CoA synthetase
VGIGETNMSRANCNVANFLLEGKPAGRMALRLLAEDISYGDLQAAVASFSRYFVEIGSRKGDRVILAGENSHFWVAAYLGILHAGLVCVPLPTALAAEDLEHVLRVTESRVAAVQSVFAAKHAALLRGFHLITDRDTTGLSGPLTQTHFAQIQASLSEDWVPPCAVQSDDLAALMFTSGSTGTPRGVMVSHRNIIANTESIIECLELTAADRMMTVLPFHYCFGTSLLHTHLRVGASLVLDSRFMYPEIILQRMQETACTGFAGVPSHFQILLRNSGLRSKSFPHLRHVQQAGGHLTPAFVQELKQALPGTEIFVMYGQTEATARLSCLSPKLLDTKLGSVGKGIPGVTLRVVDESGRGVRPGEVGEIVAEGENVTLGYWREPAETATTFRNQALHTGDLATVDEDGFIYIVDRAKDFLKCGGKRISCRQVENQLQEFECLLEAAVLATPDDVLGEAVKAFLVARRPDCPTFEDCFRAYCKEHMLPHLVPRDFVVVPALPKNSAGKVLKQKLRT